MSLHVFCYLFRYIELHPNTIFSVRYVFNECLMYVIKAFVARILMFMDLARLKKHISVLIACNNEIGTLKRLDKHKADTIDDENLLKLNSIQI